VKVAGGTPAMMTTQPVCVPAAVPGVTKRTRSSAPWRMSPNVLTVHVVCTPALTAEQLKLGLGAFASTPVVVETKMTGLLLATVPAGAVAVMLKVNDDVFWALPVGPPTNADETVQLPPICGLQTVGGVAVPEIDGGRELAAWVSS